MLFLKGLFSSVTTWLVIAMMAMSTGFFVYYKYTQKEIDNYKLQIGIYQAEVIKRNATIDILKESIDKIQAINKDIQILKDLDNIQKENMSLSLQKLEDAARGKPTLVQGIINKASKDRLRCLEIATGSPVKQEEKNSVCPQLLKK